MSVGVSTVSSVRTEWSRPTDARIQTLDLALKTLVPIGLIVLSILAVKLGSLEGYLRLFSSSAYATPLLAAGACFTLATLVFQAVRTILWWRYKPYELPPGPLPRITVVIPAFNEGPMVEKAVYSAVLADYPASRLEIICIDDGSRDDTWLYLNRAAKRYPHLVKAIRFPKNRGKREALYVGITQGRGKYIVTVDSDSVIAPQTLKQIIAPMLQDSRIGAVAGNIKVYNQGRSLMARMLAVRFVLSFDFIRASQSQYGSVVCTPGALSAYRREALMPILEKWRQQTFLGVRSTIGEDRAFTNLVLRQGYYTAYQRSAVVHTIVPESYRGLCKMFLRWERSNFRESYVQLSYLFTNYRRENRLLPILEFLITQMEFPLTCIILPLAFISLFCYPLGLLKCWCGLGIVSFVWLYAYLYQERSMNFVYGILYSYFSACCLPWIRPYAFLTVRNGKWLTR